MLDEVNKDFSVVVILLLHLSSRPEKIDRRDSPMAHPVRRNSFSVVSSDSSHCHRCQLDIDADPQCNGRTRILCPFCGEFLTRANLPTIQLLKQDMEVSGWSIARHANGE